MGTLVSIVVPCHNHARYLRRAVDSALAQTYDGFEIVIVNDGSTDDTHEVATQLIARHPEAKITLIDQEQMGAPRARNSGVAGSSGEYVLLMDSDDTIEPEMLAETVAVMDADPRCGIVYTYTRHRCDPDDPPERVFEDSVQEYPEFDFAHWVRRNPQLDACSLVRRQAFDETGGLDPGQFAEDLDLWLGITKRGWRARLVPKPLFNYWHHGGARESGESWTQPIQLRWQLIHKHPELYDEGERLFVASLMLGLVAADAIGVVETFSGPSEAGFDWILGSDQVRRVHEQFAELLAACEGVAEAKVSGALKTATDDMLAVSRQAGGALADLEGAAEARDLEAAALHVQELEAILPTVGERMVAVHEVGMAEIYGPTRDGTGRTH